MERYPISIQEVDNECKSLNSNSIHAQVKCDKIVSHCAKESRTQQSMHLMRTKRMCSLINCF
jgi:hypothetical protein